MGAFLKRIFSAPVFEDQEKANQVRLLHPIVVGVFVASSIAVPILFILAPKDSIQFLFGRLALIFFSGLSLYLEKRGEVRRASRVLIIMLLGVFAWLMFAGPGIYDPAFLGGHLIAIVFAGLLFGDRASLLVAGFGFVVGLIVVILGESGQYTFGAQIPAGAYLGISVLMFAILLIFQRLSTRISDGMIAKIQRELQERRKVEEEIRQLNAELEVRVRQRTTELETANQELEAFSYSVSHDLRAPLRGIDGFTQILQAEYGDQLDEAGQKLMMRVRENSMRMNNLIDDLLVFSQLVRGEVHRTDVDMGLLVKIVCDELEPEFTDRRIDWRVSALPSCPADASLMKQVLLNLIQNAIKYTRPRDPAIIEIGAYPEGEQTIYFVRDNGVGFDMKYADKLFGVFQRLHRDDEFEGTGIGLATAQRIVQRHGGRIWAESEPDAGATFYFVVEAHA